MENQEPSQFMDTDLNSENGQNVTGSYSEFKMRKTRNILFHTEYTKAILEENTDYNYDEERVLAFKANWRKLAFQGADQNKCLDLEIGIGNGFHFQNLVERSPDRLLVGLELKYKPLIQSVRRVLETGAKNFRIARYDAMYLADLFAEGELNNIYIHFPDPWAKKRHLKNRLIQKDFLDLLYRLQRPGSFIEFKTDHREYFESTLDIIPNTAYKISRQTFDLHNSEWSAENFQTHFEKLWTSKGLPSHMMRLERL